MGDQSVTAAARSFVASAELVQLVEAWEKWAEYKPFGTYWSCRVCNQTWWDEGLFRGPRHRWDCLVR